MFDMSDEARREAIKMARELAERFDALNTIGLGHDEPDPEADVLDNLVRDSEGFDPDVSFGVTLEDHEADAVQLLAWDMASDEAVDLVHPDGRAVRDVILALLIMYNKAVGLGGDQ